VCQNKEWHFTFVILLSFYEGGFLNVILQSVILLSVILLSVVMLRVMMLSSILKVILLSFCKV